ncbi:MAG: hypothetical protein ACI9Y1_002153 [Lentisphaeria bacterium]
MYLNGYFFYIEFHDVYFLCDDPAWKRNDVAIAYLPIDFKTIGLYLVGSGQNSQNPETALTK